MYMICGEPRKTYCFRLSEREIDLLDRVAAAHNCNRAVTIRWLIIEAAEALEKQTEAGEE